MAKRRKLPKPPKRPKKSSSYKVLKKYEENLAKHKKKVADIQKEMSEREKLLKKLGY